MANENFGLSFTIESLALWGDPSEGTQGPYGELIFVDKTDMQGAFGEISPIISSESQSTFGEFTFIIERDMQGAFAETNTNGLCISFNILGGPGQSILSGPPVNHATCP